ncbi:Rrf2 family transcriptional regulator [Convivina praedatoris]|uniref:HTH-type transcriptional regulator YwnA n=1 Tax=Convivina praedatoris TaxID=2880963 RepID=A0ABN8HEY2_9LACO|nr:Rrf2 family transcriptional regulator [Convivina sp. LMG 32447]CAH1851856.1 Putative HTH-type transcriptional regulator YwnA [Convivina sp. LMG 32447]CAH1851889.1 Putative HTH-type transcriptional regulator YwnA [Convivina sp. LMG 32447]CAH1853002.1 Putative HTH-type transcriptional regulator YwnA [Convivina sp. LMG 32447]
MKYSLQFSDALHILAYLKIFEENEGITSQQIAESVNTNPTRIRRIMGKLKKAGLICSTSGVATPSLAKSVDQITFLAVYQALDEQQRVIPIDENTNLECPVGKNIKKALAIEYDQLDQVVEQQLAKMTLGDLVANL